MKIDFYILDTPHKQQAMLFACKLIEKAHAQNEKVFIHTASPLESEKIDQLLWTYRENSFIPHELNTEAATAPILIGETAPAANMNGALINFNHELPAFHSQFNRIIEIVHSEPKAQQHARTRYKQYRDANHDLTTHKLKANEL